MTKQRLKFIILIALLVITVIATTGCRRRHRMPEPSLFLQKQATFLINKISKELNFTEEQKAISNKIKEEIIVKHEEMRKNRGKYKGEIIELIRSDRITKEQIYKFLESKELKRKKMQDFMIEKAVQFHSMLTPEQREKIIEKIEKHKFDD